MSKNEFFKKYQSYVSELISLTSAEDDSQNGIAQEERNKVAQTENAYLQTMSELRKARQIVDEQYRSIRESCSSYMGLRRPEAQRPSYTDEGWKECIKIQENEAKKIQQWFLLKKQESVAEKQRQLQLEAKQRAARALSATEAERKRKEEAEALEKSRGASLLEELKRKYRKNI